MHFLILTILLFSTMVTFFRVLPRYNVQTFHVIVVNYFTCTVVGALYIGEPQTMLKEIMALQEWHLAAFILSLFFISGFYLLALATQKTGLAIATISSRLSMVIPIIVAWTILGNTKAFNVYHIIGILLALPAILLSVSEPKSGSTKSFSLEALTLPAAVFITGGSVDTIINYANAKLLSSAQVPVFPIVAFFSAGAIGLSVILIKRKKITGKELLLGILLGSFNYFSILFLLQALEYYNHDGAYVFPILNITSILINTGVGIAFFSEKMYIRKIIGVVISILVIILLNIHG